MTVVRLLFARPPAFPSVYFFAHLGKEMTSSAEPWI